MEVRSFDKRRFFWATSERAFAASKVPVQRVARERMGYSCMRRQLLICDGIAVITSNKASAEVEVTGVADLFHSSFHGFECGRKAIQLAGY